ncbi:helix-turn-helix domain-containing protein [Corynebacterium sp. zg-331]|uniref:helix-turn-helix domain-containing protein n=1 Tax=unclassified Corynebacterium TaxID=2624378 RepID=UPI001642FE25|nr:helix-turn-helix domain-containing protein [Corynebacterium sp. zg-331]
MERIRGGSVSFISFIGYDTALTQTTNPAESSHDINAIALRQLNRTLSGPSPTTVAITTECPADPIRISRDVADSLRTVLAHAVAGRAVSIIPACAELTTQQAAALLNVSRPYVVKLIDEGTLPCHKVGSHRRLYASDVKKYQHDRAISARMAADKLTALSEEMGLYE